MHKYILPLLISTLLSANTVGGIAILVQNEPITLFEIKETVSSENLTIEQSVQKLIRQKLEAIEIKERNIHVSSQEILAEIKTMAQQNAMDVNQFYVAMEQSRGIGERELKAKIKESLLNKKLYNTIAFSKLSQPTNDEIQEYYNLHKEQFARPQSFDLIVYQSPSAEKLQQQVANPMFYSRDVHTEDVTLEYATIDPNLANMLHHTKTNTFTQIIPNPKGGYMSFFIKNKSATTTSNMEAYANEVTAAIMSDKRNQILNDYFSRLRINANIETLRLPQ